MKNTIHFNLGRFSRLSENDPEENKKKQSQDDLVWEKIIDQLGHHCFSYKDLHASIEIDWLPAAEHKKELDKITSKLNDITPTGDEHFEFLNQFSDLYFKKIPLIADVEISGILTEFEVAFLPKVILEKHLYDVFMIANLTSPGSCDFLNVEFPKKDGSKEKLHLSSHFFELMDMGNLSNTSWPVNHLDFDLVMSWYKNVNSTFKTTSETNIEKALFSTMHICKSEDFDETTIIWIFHALEALFGTKVGEGFSNLINRMALLLELDDKQKEKTKKTLRKMYEFRSALVHGGYKVPHPIRPIEIDERMENKFIDTNELCQSGFNMIVASIQKMIKNNWQEIYIMETIQGKTIGS